MNGKGKVGVLSYIVSQFLVTCELSFFEVEGSHLAAGRHGTHLLVNDRGCLVGARKYENMRREE